VLSFLIAYVLVVSPPRYDEECEDEATTGDMIECFSRELREEEMRLSAVEQQLIERASLPEAVLQRRANALWVIFRDVECKAELERYSGGSIAPVLGLACRLQLTTARIAEIEAKTDMTGKPLVEGT
jgi:uncharacterized protein YecT (DUF1311 family)